MRKDSHTNEIFIMIMMHDAPNQQQGQAMRCSAVDNSSKSVYGSRLSACANWRVAYASWFSIHAHFPEPTFFLTNATHPYHT